MSNIGLLGQTEVEENEVISDVRIQQWHDKIFYKSFYKKRTAMYLHGDINYTNKTASFASYVAVLCMFVLIIFASTKFESLVGINVYFLSTDHKQITAESIAKHSPEETYVNSYLLPKNTSQLVPIVIYMGKIKCGHLKVWFTFSDSKSNSYDPQDLECTYHENITAACYTIKSEMQ